MARENQRLSRERITRNRLERPKGWVAPGAMVQVDPNALGPEIRLRWISKFITKSEIDYTRFFDRQQRGWVPVKPEELPKLGHLKDPDGNIAKNGCILCKIDASIAQMDVEFFEDQAIGALEGSSREFTNSDDNNKAMPKFQESKRTSFKGRLPS